MRFLAARPLEIAHRVKPMIVLQNGMQACREEQLAHEAQRIYMDQKPKCDRNAIAALPFFYANDCCKRVTLGSPAARHAAPNTPTNFA